MDSEYRYQELENFIHGDNERVSELLDEAKKLEIKFPLVDSDVERLVLFIKEEFELQTVQTEYVRKIIATYEYMTSHIDECGNSMFYDLSNGKDIHQKNYILKV